MTINKIEVSLFPSESALYIIPQNALQLFSRSVSFWCGVEGYIGGSHLVATHYYLLNKIFCIIQTDIGCKIRID